MPFSRFYCVQSLKKLTFNISLTWGKKYRLNKVKINFFNIQSTTIWKNFGKLQSWFIFSFFGSTEYMLPHNITLNWEWIQFLLVFHDLFHRTLFNSAQWYFSLSVSIFRYHISFDVLYVSSVYFILRLLFTIKKLKTREVNTFQKWSIFRNR